MIGTSSGQLGARSALRSFGSPEEGRVFSLQLARRLLGLLRPSRTKMFIAMALMVVATGMNLLAPYLIKVAIDEHIMLRDISGLIHTTLLLAVVYSLACAATAGQRYVLGWVAQSVLVEMRSRLFRHLQRLHVGYHDTTVVGITVSRVINDVGAVNELLTQGLVTVFGDVLLLAGTIAVMLSLDVRLALYSFAVIPVMVVVTLVFSRHARIAYRRTRQTIASVVGDLAENISGIRAIQAFTQEQRKREEFDQTNIANLDSHVRAMSVSFLFLPAVEFLGVAAIAIVLWFGGLHVIAGGVTIGILVAFIAYVSQFFQPIRELAQIYSTMQSALAAGEQVFHLLETEPGIPDAVDAGVLTDVNGRIEFLNVSLSYRAGEPVLQDLTFEIEPETTVALVGPTGAGKTSIANLILRFYDPTAGSVKLDGHDLRHVTQASLRRHMAVVPQEPFLFSGTILDNIRFGVPSAELDSVEAMAKRVHLHEFITSLPEGYRTTVQEGAVNLSHGQRQLICIARALMVNPRVLIMDEATSNIDSRTEGLVLSAMEEALRNRTSVIIAHRLSTVRKANRVLVVSDGRIVESGAHEELIRRNKVYASLVRRQFGEQPP